MRRAVAPLLTVAGLFALAACGEGDTAATSTQTEIYGNVTPTSPGTEPNAPPGAIPPPQPNPENGDVMGQRATPGTDTRGAIAPGTQRDPALPSTPPTLPREQPAPASPAGAPQ